MMPESSTTLELPAPAPVRSSDWLDADDEAYKLAEETEAIAEAERCYWMVEAQ